MRPSRGAASASGLLPVPLLEAVDTTRGVHQFLLSGEEWMAVRADLQAKFLLGRTGGPDGATGAVNVHLFVIGMNSSFQDRKSTRLNSSHSQISYAVFCLKKKKKHTCCSTTDYSSKFSCSYADTSFYCYYY